LPTPKHKQKPLAQLDLPEGLPKESAATSRYLITTAHPCAIPKGSTVKSTKTTILKFVFGLAILGFTSWRTYNLMGFTSPDFITTVLGLVLFDAGALVWLVLYLKDATGGPQRAIAQIAFGCDLVLTILAVIADLIIAGTLIERPDWVGVAALVIISLAAAINIILLYIYHLNDPEVLRENQQRDLSDAEDAADYRIEKETIKKIEEDTPALAAEVAGIKSQAWIEARRAKYGVRTKPTIAIDSITHKQVEPLETVPSANGNGAHPKS
jgi:hypothetical protein